MSNFFLALFLLLFGVMHLVDTKIPGWVLGLVAVISALSIGWQGWRKGELKP